MRRLGTEEASRHYPASGTRLEADPLQLELAEWWLEVGCWRPKPVKQNISRHIDGQEDKRVGSEVASLRQAASTPPCSPPLCHPVDEGWLATMGWLSSSGRPAGRWCYVCRECTHTGVIYYIFIFLLLLKCMRISERNSSSVMLAPRLLSLEEFLAYSTVTQYSSLALASPPLGQVTV